MANKGTADIKNKKASFNYFIYEKYEAGIVLQGSEVKSLRDGKANLVDSYVQIEGQEAFIKNVHISPYSTASEKNYDPRRTRKLLLHKYQISKLVGKAAQRGFTIVPLRIYFKKGKAKAEIAICKGKHRFDKRESIKKKMQQREIHRVMRKK